MLARMKMAWGLNVALTKLGIEFAVDATYRRGVADVALRDGLSPEQAAVFLLYQLPMGVPPLGAESVVEQWIAEGRITRAMVDEAKRARYLS